MSEVVNTMASTEDKPQYPGSGSQENPFLVSFDVPDKENPRDFSIVRKWGVNIIAALTMMTGTFSVSAYSTGVSGMIQDLETSSEVAIVGQTLFLIGLGLGSVVFPPTADYYGRKRVVVLTSTVFTCFSIGVAAARNIATVLVCRFFSGFAASAAQSLIVAQVPALFSPKHVAVPLTTAAIAPFLGPCLGPLLGGYVTEYSGSWRNINWLAMAMAGLFTVLYFLFVPETHSPYILRRRAAKLSKESMQHYVSAADVKGRLSVTAELQLYLARPFIYLFTEPIVLIFTLYVSFLYGILNLFFEAFPVIYLDTRHWSEGNAGLPFIALLVGFILSVPFTMLCGKPYMKVLDRDGKAPPELRLLFAMVSAVLLPISLFWIGWTGRPNTSWVAPVIAGGIFGFSMIGLTMSIFVYLADVYGPTVGAAYAALNFVRFFLASFFPLFAFQMYDNLGIPWASSTLAFILVAFLPAPYLFYIFGPKIRSWSRLTKKENMAAVKA